MILACAGPQQHGVRAHAEALAAHTPQADVVSGPAAELWPTLCRPGPAVHVHLTDGIFGGPSTEAAAAIEQLSAHRPVSVTLHDIPQQSDGVPWPTRRTSYARICAAARSVQVCSEWERELLRQAVGDAAADAAAVVPLPIDPPDEAATPATHQNQVAVLGFVYPGKGHAEVLAAMAGLDPGVDLIALGRASAGHADLIDALATTAAAQGRRFHLTGYLSDDALTRAARQAAVPVVAPTHVSASGSLGRWISAGRRPVVATHPYFAEIAARAPWAMSLTDDLPAALAAALEHPATTWIHPEDWDATLLPDTAAAARAQWAAIHAGLAR